MQASKPWYKSRTSWATLITALIACLSALGLTDGDLEVNVEQGADLIVTLVTAGLGVAGFVTNIIRKTRIRPGIL